MNGLLIASICYYLFGSSRRILLAAGLVMELVYCALRGISLERLPLIGPHDTLVFFALSIAVMGVATSFSVSLKGAGWFTFGTGFGAGLFALLALAFPASAMPLPLGNVALLYVRSKGAGSVCPLS